MRNKNEFLVDVLKSKLDDNSIVAKQKQELAELALTDPVGAISMWKQIFNLGQKSPNEFGNLEQYRQYAVQRGFLGPQKILMELGKLSGRDLGKVYYVRCSCGQRQRIMVGPPQNAEFEPLKLKCCTGEDA